MRRRTVAEPRESAEASLPVGWQFSGPYRFDALWVALADDDGFDAYASETGGYAEHALRRLQDTGSGPPARGARMDWFTVSRPAAEGWIGRHVKVAGAIEVAHERPWATVLRVPVADGVVWFKACGRVQAFEPRLTDRLYARWPDRVTEVLAHDEQRAWLLLADAGVPIGIDASPELWLAALPLYAELQRGEVAYAHEHLRHRVPDLRVVTLPARYDQLLEHDLPLAPEELDRLRTFAPRYAELCAELIAHAIPETVQHDDLHGANVYQRGPQLRLLDWGDASIAHPFASLVVTFRFLDEIRRLPLTDRWYARLRDAYLEPWGSGLTSAFALALRVGVFAHTFAWARQRDALPPEAVPDFDKWFRVVLLRAVAQTAEAESATT